jgi:NADP-dependent 3-hydroxy acid dehydrogenase YdfG
MSQVTVAVVAGARGVLGHATATALTARGLTVITLDRSEHAMSGVRGAAGKETADPADGQLGRGARERAILPVYGG